METPLRWLWVAGFALLLTARGVSEQPAGTQVAPPKTFVGCPEFEIKGGKFSGGTACLAKLENNPQLYLLTVRHLFGPACGLPELIKPAQIPGFVQAVQLHCLFTPGFKRYRLEGLNVPVSADEHGALFDLAVFKAKEGFISDAGTITLEKPVVGETVWVIAQLTGDTAPAQFMHPVKITQNDGEWLLGEFDDPKIITKGASGAPVLNKAGKIVGVYSGHGVGKENGRGGGKGKGKNKGKEKEETGKVVTFLIPVSLIVKVIEGKPLSP